MFIDTVFMLITVQSEGEKKAFGFYETHLSTRKQNSFLMRLKEVVAAQFTSTVIYPVPGL